MIYKGQSLNRELRTIPFLKLQEGELYQSYNLVSEEERERFYIITTLKCPCKCKFCLFILTADEMQDCPDSVLAETAGRVLRAFPDTNFSISITGGEPLMFEKRIIALLNAIRDNTSPQMVRWIGFGTSGTTKLPLYLNSYPDFHFDLYLSRHHYDLEKQTKAFVNNVRPHDVSEYSNLHDHVSVRLTCNLIGGGIDSLKQIKRYLGFAKSRGVKYVTFRELNKISGDASMYAQNYILDYIDYYGESLVPLQDILATVEVDSEFKFISQDIRPFIYHERWGYGDIEVTFRRVDEEQLLQYNDSFDDIDEVVLHPDGLVTGCWDRNQKILDLSAVK